MTRRFEDLASEVKRSWSADAHLVNEAAAKVFRAEVTAMEELGSGLATARRDLNISQQALAESSGIAQSEISRIETGRANPTIETVTRLTTALGKKLVLQ